MSDVLGLGGVQWCGSVRVGDFRFGCKQRPHPSTPPPLHPFHPPPLLLRPPVHTSPSSRALCALPARPSRSLREGCAELGAGGGVVVCVCVCVGGGIVLCSPPPSLCACTV
jgi:hypothetical protein